MKALLKKIFCFLISCTMFACPIYSNANYHNSLLEVHAEDTTMHYNQWLVLFLASLGLSISSLAPNPSNWVGDELEKFIKRYQQDEQERIQNALIEWQAQMNELKGKPIVEVPPILYNVFNSFVNYFEKDKGLTSSNNVTIGNIQYNSYITVPAHTSYYIGTHINGDNHAIKEYTLKADSEYRGVSYMENVRGQQVIRTFYFFNDDKVHKLSYSWVDNYFLSTSHIYNGHSYLEYGTSIGSGFTYSDFYNINLPYISSEVLQDYQAYEYVYGSEMSLDDKVIGAGDLKLDDRVLETNDKATLDLTNVNFGQGVGVDATIADISKWLNGVINGTQDLDWGKVVPVPDVKPIPIPEPTTEPLPTTEPIPTTEPGPTPFPPGEIENYQTPSLTNVFPFCIPYDVVKFFGVLNAEPKAPKWTFDLNNFSEGYKLSIDMKDYDTIIVVFRYGMLGLFIVGLILITRYIVGGQ